MIKKLKVLVIILILNVTVLYAQDTQSYIDTSQVIVPTVVVRQILADLEEGDINKDIILQQEKVISLQDSLLLLDSVVMEKLQEQLDVQNEIRSLTEETLLTKNNEIKTLKKDLRKQKMSKSIFEATTIVSTIGLIISLIF